jgi:hypothetical protein
MGERCVGICVSRLLSVLGRVLHADDPLPLALSPDRWDNLPEAVKSLPGLYANTMSFSAGPRVRFFCYFARLWSRLTNALPYQSCIGQRFSLIEMKTFLYVLITNFVFAETDETVVKSNVCVANFFFSAAEGRAV